MRIPSLSIFFLALLLTGCGASEPMNSSDTSDSVAIHMPPTGFDPETITVKKNTKVCYINDDTEARWPASNIHPTHEIFPEFDPKTVVRSGETWCFTFTKAGIWKFHDHLFPEFSGTVNVE